MVNIIAAVVIVLLFSGACIYIIREKKKGNHCIGCPMADHCPRKGKPCEERPEK
ncbi:MAG: FeoB-associated Cys-rich membrane protein [Lachnospiraceae bacterium]|nr:FeoB-associated Cys-rich membrane protein [Lachnospiraceae bacterium]